MSDFDSKLKQRLEKLQEQNLYRSLKRVESPQGTRIHIGGKTCLNFSSNDYLGLANDERLKAAAVAAIEKYGAGSGASRLICGSLATHHELEEALAEFKQAEAAITFSSGYATALGVICALVGKDDVIVLDKFVHASIVDAARLSGAKMRVFAHNDLNELEDILKWRAEKSGTGQTLVVTESVFSMDGDAAPLKAIIELKEKYGAWLMVDEAHATGLYGPRGAGLAQEAGVSDQIEVQMGTLGKALGAAGGYVCGSRALIDHLTNVARSFIFSTAPVPANSAAAAAAIGFVRSQEGAARRQALWALVAEAARTILQHPASSAILPMIIGSESAALGAAGALFDRGIYVPAIRYPSVARGKARLRFTITASHAENDLRALQKALAETIDRDQVPTIAAVAGA